MLSREDSHRSHTGAVQAVHPLLGAHVHLLEEPERHVWQAGVGTGAHPWLGDHRIHNVAAFPGAAYCEMALAAARTTLGELSEVRDIKFEQTLLLDEQTVVSSAATIAAPGSYSSQSRVIRKASPHGGPARCCTHWRRCRSRPGTTRTL